ncbi:MAG TPA: isocitrate lyase/phosphoenolpyruvate mutase family protein [Actinocrinis sp.]|nr:isocitrate lyase/phosphoenolpyruvate mutase family protein [Actinocrinis sp.]
MSNLTDKARLFRELHNGDPVLALPNAWDVASARLIESAGATAIATTSAGVAWSLGAADGDELDRDRALDFVSRVAAAVAVPVTADIESGFAFTAEGVAETVRGVLSAGAVGVNLEDALHHGDGALRAVGEQAERIAAARRAADVVKIPLFINARVDTYLRAIGDPGTRFQETVDRAAAYLAAGADGIFVPGVADLDVVGKLAEAIQAPLNVLVGYGSPSVSEFAAVGVARVSLGSSIASAAYAVAGEVARELFGSGTYESLAGALPYQEINSLLH